MGSGVRVLSVGCPSWWVGLLLPALLGKQMRATQWGATGMVPVPGTTKVWAWLRLRLPLCR